MNMLKEKMGAQLAGQAPAPSGQDDRGQCSTLRVFDSFEFGAIRTAVSEDGEPLLNAHDVAVSLGYRDAERITRLLDADEVDSHLVGVLGGKQSGRFITESGFYHVVMARKSAFIKDPDKRASAARFQRWVTHEVLPSIRRTGGYMTAAPDETPDQLMARALLVAQEALQRRDAVIAEQAAAIEERDRSIALQDAVIARTEAQVEAMAPKALFADAMTASDRTYLIGEAAKIIRQNGIDMGQNRLFRILRDDWGLLGRRGCNWNLPTQRAMDMGLFHVKETIITHSDGHTTVSRTSKLTGKGLQYVVTRLAKGDGQLAIDVVTA